MPENGNESLSYDPDLQTALTTLQQEILLPYFKAALTNNADTEVSSSTRRATIIG